LGTRVHWRGTGTRTPGAEPMSSEPAIKRRSSGVMLRVVEASQGESSADDGEIPLEKLYERYAPYVAAIAMRILGREGEVDDLVQDVFAMAVRGLRRRREHLEIRSWLATVTVRRSMYQLRRRAFWGLLDLAEEPNYEKIADHGASVEQRQLVSEVYRALDRLPSRQRVPWVLRHIEGESLQRVADLCGCSLATAKRRIEAAHGSISRAVEGRGRHGS
jgi:RNA polymerase sigma-70 factor, ECF subfamily